MKNIKYLSRIADKTLDLRLEAFDLQYGYNDAL